MKYINEYNDFEKNLFDQVNSKPEMFIFNLIENLEIKSNEYKPHYTYFVYKETEEVWMMDDKENGILWVSYDTIWSKIELSFPHKDLNIKELIKYVVKLTFKMKVGTPQPSMFLREVTWN